jgi:hypothetical protein
MEFNMYREPNDNFDSDLTPGGVDQPDTTGAAAEADDNRVVCSIPYERRVRIVARLASIASGVDLDGTPVSPSTALMAARTLIQMQRIDLAQQKLDIQEAKRRRLEERRRAQEEIRQRFVIFRRKPGGRS